ncbi:hypothetical protein SCUCBS95973_004716 [Sporothrix curviconia]|uniref:Uncharacterized protein n=1 Tax=Sporothrix curviconia TaxID=1260050 RepID=A0ABP0BQY7_9PEZI
MPTINRSGMASEPLFAPLTEPTVVQSSVLFAQPAGTAQIPEERGQTVVVTGEEAAGEDIVVDCPIPHHKKKKPCGYKICGCFQGIVDKFPIPCRICWYFWCPCCIPCPMNTERDVDSQSNINITAETVVNTTAEPAAVTGAGPMANTVQRPPTPIVIYALQDDGFAEPHLVTTPALSTMTA